MLVLFSTTVNATPTILDTLNYKEIKLIAIPGDINLILNQTTNDIALLMRFYDPISNVTVYSVQSKEVTFDSTFVNDTKSYSFYDQYGNDYYICINYSSIQVPPTMAQIIAGYTATIDNLTANITTLKSQIDVLNVALNQSYVDLNASQLAYNQKVIENQVLLIALSNSSTLNEKYGNDINSLEFKISQLSEYKNSWAIATSTGLYFNYSSAVITLIAMLILIGIVWFVKQGKPVPILSQAKSYVFKQPSEDKKSEPKVSSYDEELLKDARGEK